MTRFINSILFMASVILAWNLVIPIASAKSFKDIPASYSGYDSIEWAVKKGIIHGFTDGTYRKSDTLTEAQFAAVLARYFEPTIDVLPAAGHWSDRYYRYLETFNLFLPGHKDNQKRSEPLPRVELAKLLAKSQNPVLDNEHAAVQWLYDEGITKGYGKSADTYVDFNPTGILERGQVALFFKRLHDSNLRSILREGYVAQDTIRGEELRVIMHAKWEGQFVMQNGNDVARTTLRLPEKASYRLDIHLADNRVYFSLFETDSTSIQVVADTIATSFKLTDSVELYNQLEKALADGSEEIIFLGRPITFSVSTTPFSKIYSISLPY